MIVHVRDLRLMEPVYCINGTKEFFAKHGMDWKKFCKEGLDEEEFLKTGDIMAIKLVEAARGRK
ncbi:tail assembly chaperone [Vibrio phage K251 g3]